MSLCDDRVFLRLARKWTEGAAAAALRGIGAVSRKKHRAVHTNESVFP